MTQQAEPTAHQASEVVLGWLGDSQPSDRVAHATNWGKEQWEAARWAIQVHGIAPLLYQHLSRNATLDQLPPHLQTYLADQYRLNRQRVTAMMAELSIVLHAAKQAGIDIAPLKGGLLVSYYYDDPALRPMSDLDLLVRREDQPRLARVLLELGYQMTQNTPRHQSYALAQPGQRIIYTQGEHPDNPHGLDLHTKVQEQIWCVRYEMTQEVWAGCQSALFGGAPALLIAPLDLLQHLLIHATGDLMVGRARLIQLYDIALVGSWLNLSEWGLLVAAGQRRREERLLYAPLLLAERYLGRVAPSDALARLESGTPTSLRAFLHRVDLYYLSFCNPRTMSLADKLSLYRPGWEQLRALRCRLVPTPHEIRELYPRLARLPLAPIAYLIHSLRILIWPVRQVLRVPRLSWIYRERGGKW